MEGRCARLQNLSYSLENCVQKQIYRLQKEKKFARKGAWIHILEKFSRKKCLRELWEASSRKCNMMLVNTSSPWQILLRIWLLPLISQRSRGKNTPTNYTKPNLIAACLAIIVFMYAWNFCWELLMESLWLNYHHFSPKTLKMLMKVSAKTCNFKIRFMQQKWPESEFPVTSKPEILWEQNGSFPSRVRVVNSALQHQNKTICLCQTGGIFIYLPQIHISIQE